MKVLLNKKLFIFLSLGIISIAFIAHHQSLRQLGKESTVNEKQQDQIETKETTELWKRDNIQQQLNGNVVGKCKPVKNLVFIKVEKCGGSTLSNIFLRFGERQNLSFVLPEPGRSNITKKILYEHIGRCVNMIVHHSTYDGKLMQRIMPQDTVYIGVIREPLNHLKSFYNYHNFGNKQSMPGLARFEENPWKFMNQLGNLQNRQSVRYGWANNGAMSNKSAWDFVKMIDRKFDIVLISDHMKESLVLLKDVLCWSWEDMLYVSHKVANESAAIRYLKKEGRRESSSLDHAQNRILAKANLRRFSMVDYAMFDFFNHSLWQNIKMKGGKFQKDLAHFDEKLKIIQKTCKYTEDDLTLTEKYLDKIIHLSPSSPEYRCHRMLLPPIYYSKYILHPKREHNTCIRN
ncbi:unnamed protein product [Owenia fusiformis]|uniref:Uncharacterized protein n=1 Tax=Owenia fusiformis TaxID=6347 RepID=A0A8J1T9U1_OWEFU|nr:unnamed protein product [Owenia fusiformis]